MLIKGEILYKISLGFNMKKIISFLVFVSIAVFAYSQPNYANGNGTIIKVENTGKTTRTFRKHIQRIQTKNIADINVSFIKNLNLYKNPEIKEDEIVGKLNYGDFINIEQILETNTGKEYSVWFYLSKDDGIKGWFFGGECETGFEYGRAPYAHNRWEIIEHININNKVWTIRKLVHTFVLLDGTITTNMYDKPGLRNTNVISKISNPDSPELFVRATAATEEEETINGKTDRWLKINYEGTEGWIFGAPVSPLFNIPPYDIPEVLIWIMFGFFFP
jgi:hypothetical protein